MLFDCFESNVFLVLLKNNLKLLIQLLISKMNIHFKPIFYYLKNLFHSLFILFLLFFSSIAFSKDEVININGRILFIPSKKNYPYAEEIFRTPPITLFDTSSYDHVLEDLWPSSSPSFNQLIYTEDEQKILFENMLDRYYGEAITSKSPWNSSYIDSLFSEKSLPQLVIPEKFLQNNSFSNNDTKFYGANFKPYYSNWFTALDKNINIANFETKYEANHRAITVDNATLRLSPTIEPLFYDIREPGEGYPFDAFQESMLRPGTPVYVMGVSLDKAWAFVIAPEARGWTPIKNLARTSNEFIKKWRYLSKNLGAVIKNHLAISNRFDVLQFIADIGTLLPIIPSKNKKNDISKVSKLSVYETKNNQKLFQKIAIPIVNQKGFAEIDFSDVAAESLVSVPWQATPKHFIDLINQMKARPYGWGSAYGYNDCSAELRSILAPFGIWLPRFSGDQMEYLNSIDYSALSPPERINRLIETGKPFRTIVNFGKHTTLYIGKKIKLSQNSLQPSYIPYVYQNLWSIRDKDKKRRAIVGGAYVMPVTESFNYDPQLIGQAALYLFQLGEAVSNVSK